MSTSTDDELFSLAPREPYIRRGTRITVKAETNLETLNRVLHSLRFNLVKAGDVANVGSVNLCLDLLEEAFPDPGAKTS